MCQHILAELGLSESNYDCTLTKLMCLMLQFKIAAREFSRTIEMKAFYLARSVPMHRVIISARRYIKTTQLIFSVKTNNRLWLIRCDCEGGCFTVIQLIFPHKLLSVTTSDYISEWHQRRSGGVTFPARRGNTWLCAEDSPAVVWPPAFHTTDYASLNHRPKTSTRSPLNSSQRSGFTINTADSLLGQALSRQSGSPPFSACSKLLTVVPLATWRLNNKAFKLEEKQYILILKYRKIRITSFSMEENSHLTISYWETYTKNILSIWRNWGGGESPSRWPQAAPSCKALVTC